MEWTRTESGAFHVYSAEYDNRRLSVAYNRAMDCVDSFSDVLDLSGRNSFSKRDSVLNVLMRSQGAARCTECHQPSGESTPLTGIALEVLKNNFEHAFEDLEYGHAFVDASLLKKIPKMRRNLEEYYQAALKTLSEDWKKYEESRNLP